MYSCRMRMGQERKTFPITKLTVIVSVTLSSPIHRAMYNIYRSIAEPFSILKLYINFSRWKYEMKFSSRLGFVILLIWNLVMSIKKYNFWCKSSQWRIYFPTSTQPCFSLNRIKKIQSQYWKRNLGACLWYLKWIYEWMRCMGWIKKEKNKGRIKLSYLFWLLDGKCQDL